MLEAIKQFVEKLKSSNYKKILFLTTSNRAGFHAKPDKEGHSKGEMSKSTYFAYKVKNLLEQQGKEVILLEIPHLKIYPCEGNVSGLKSKGCGVKEALLKDREKNPSGLHRCWASLNNKDDELWKVSKELFEADAVVFFASVRWGQANSEYQKLIERLTWIENRWSQLKEETIRLPDAGIVVLGQNYNVANVLDNQLKVLQFFKFPTPKELALGWQASSDSKDEDYDSYLKGIDDWMKDFGCNLYEKKEGELNG